MKIAVAADGNHVSQHFGHCENFCLYEMNDGGITKKEVISNPGHAPGFLPDFLNEKSIDVIIAGKMGKGAVKMFEEKNVDVITGAVGLADSAAIAYGRGSLKSTEVFCSGHDKDGNCKH